MKRIGNLYDRIISVENLNLADMIARKKKSHQAGVKDHDKSRDENILQLHACLKEGAYKTSSYAHFTIYEPKERLISRLPYFPDRIVHHAIMNILEPIFVSCFTRDTYSCIKGRGIHGASFAIREALRDVPGTQYCLKLDIKKFYPSVDHIVLKTLLRRKFKDQQLLVLLDEIIDSAPGLPIGNYLSQYFANFYLTGFDHWIKEAIGAEYYFRYSDDIVMMAGGKERLHNLRILIEEYLLTRLHLQVKENYQVYPVSSRGIDFVGYVHYHTHVKLRKTIKKNFARMVAIRRNEASIASYNGWCLHCNSGNLIKTLLRNAV